MHTVIHIPLAEIRHDALLRDRTALDPNALLELSVSIATHGLRQPIEVWQLSRLDGIHRYGLISGLRRLTAFRALAEGRRATEFATIPAFLRAPADVPAAMAAMVTENEIRTQISPWEKGTLITRAVADGIFPTPDAAVTALYPALSKQNRARLRAFASVVETFDGCLTEPECLTAQRMESLALALRGDTADLLYAALAPVRGHSPETQWSAMLPVIREGAAALDDAQPAAGAGRPRRMLHLKQGLTIRREKTRTGWILKFTGPEARKGGLIDDVFDLVEKWAEGR